MSNLGFEKYTQDEFMAIFTYLYVMPNTLNPWIDYKLKEEKK